MPGQGNTNLKSELALTYSRLRILTKLELHDRIQIVIFAETGVNRPAAS